MQFAPIGLFESAISSNAALKETWNTFSSSLEFPVEDVEKAMVIFSNALKITRHAIKDEKIRNFWLDILVYSNFTLSIKDKEPRKYTFDTIIELVKARKEKFEIELTSVDSKKSDLTAISHVVRDISLEIFGESPTREFYQQIVNSKDTFCLIGKVNESYVACSYGTHVNVKGTEIFHLNFLGRKIEYPSLNLIENLKQQLNVVQERYPNLHFLTLCVSINNTRMISIYEKEGFLKNHYIEKGFMGLPAFFYCKPIGSGWEILPPDYAEFQEAMQLKREEQKKEYLELIAN